MSGLGPRRHERQERNACPRHRPRTVWRNADRQWFSKGFPRAGGGGRSNRWHNCNPGRSSRWPSAPRGGGVPGDVAPCHRAASELGRWSRAPAPPFATSCSGERMLEAQELNQRRIVGQLHDQAPIIGLPKVLQDEAGKQLMLCENLWAATVRVSRQLLSRNLQGHPCNPSRRLARNTHQIVLRSTTSKQHCAITQISTEPF